MIDFVRTVLIFSHLLFFSGAISVVIWSDHTILKQGISGVNIEAVKLATSCFLILLWITGLLTIFIDTGFQLQIILENPKLLIKLTCVSILTINGYLLHRVVLDKFTDTGYLCRTDAMIISTCGAVSSSHWILAAFIGSAKLLNDYSLYFLFSLYLAIGVFSVLVGIAISPLMQHRINQQRAIVALQELGVTPLPSKLSTLDYSSKTNASTRHGNRMTTHSPHAPMRL